MNRRRWRRPRTAKGALLVVRSQVERPETSSREWYCGPSDHQTTVTVQLPIVATERCTRQTLLGGDSRSNGRPHLQQPLRLRALSQHEISPARDRLPPRARGIRAEGERLRTTCPATASKGHVINPFLERPTDKTEPNLVTGDGRSQRRLVPRGLRPDHRGVFSAVNTETFDLNDFAPRRD
jgi:hypothetical protein